MLKLILPSLLAIWPFGVVNGNTCSWDNCPKWSSDPNIWNVHFIPHTHDDLGWLKTVDGYYSTEVRYILNTVTWALQQDPNRRFSYCETGFLTRWLEENPSGVEVITKLIQSGQLEIIGGGWVMPDEAASHYVDLIDQYTLGLRKLYKNFGECARPRTAWQIDPFGHSREHANILTLMGYDSLWFAREHFLEHEARMANKTLQTIWHVSDDRDMNNTIFTGNFYRLYTAPLGFAFDIRNSDEPIQDNPNLENYNLDERLTTFVNYIQNLTKIQPHNHFMMLMGDDFAYQDAYMYFSNIDKLIKHLNQNYSHILTASYSTPTCYAQAVKGLTGINWSNKYTDFFPLAGQYGDPTDSQMFWTGFFTSRPTLKGLIRKSSGLLQLSRQLHAISLTSWSSQVSAQIEVFERALALNQHHDAVAGTALEFVTQDYIYRLTKGWTNSEQVLNNAMQTISRDIKNNAATLPQQVICRTINESECDFTRSNNFFIVTVHNGNGQNLNSLIRIPLYQDTNDIAISDASGNLLAYEIVSTFNNPGQLNNTNVAPCEICFMADDIRPLGFKTYFVSVNTNQTDHNFIRAKRDSMIKKISNQQTNSISNGLIQLDFNFKGYLTKFTDLTSGQSYPLRQEFFYYHGSSDGIMNSNAYIFRPDPDNATPIRFFDTVNLEIVNSSIAIEARQIVSSWASQVIRLIPNKKYVEFEWTIGPIPSFDNITKEVITTYTIDGLKTNGTFWTDANGRQLMRRQRNWAENYVYQNTEPIAGNYYPIDTRIIISDGSTSLAILTDRSHGGGSIHDGQIEIMLHRRAINNELVVLNEPGRDGRGLVVRGKHWLILGTNSDIMTAQRTLAYEIYHAPVLTFSNYGSSDLYRHDFVTDFSGLQSPLAPNVHLLTLKQLDSNNVLVRLEHIFQKNENPTYAQPVMVDLNSLIPNFVITNVQELNLASTPVVNPSASTTIILNPMDIKTYQLTVTPGNYGNQTQADSSTTAQTSAAQSSSASIAGQSASASTISGSSNVPTITASHPTTKRASTTVVNTLSILGLVVFYIVLNIQ